MSVIGIELHHGQHGNEKLNGTSLEFSVFSRAVKKGWGSRPASFLLLQVVTALKSLFAVYHMYSPGCTASVTSMTEIISSLNWM